MESKQIAKIEPRWNDHLLLVFTDGTQQMIQRDEHRAKGLSHSEPSGITGFTEVTVHHLKVGDYYPPLPIKDQHGLPSASDLDTVSEEHDAADNTHTEA